MLKQLPLNKRYLGRSPESAMFPMEHGLGKPLLNMHYLAVTSDKFWTKILAMGIWKQDELLDFQLGRLPGLALTWYYNSPSPRAASTQQMRRSFKNRALKNLINELKARGFKSWASKNFINKSKASKTYCRGFKSRASKNINRLRISRRGANGNPKQHLTKPQKP